MLQLPTNAIIRTSRSAALAALLLGAFASHAAADDAKIKSASFTLQPVYQGDEIVVTSSDGSKWDTIDAKPLKLSATMKVDTKHPGYVKQVGILLGGCHNTGCANNPVMYYAPTSTRDYNDNRVFTFPGNKIPLSKNGIAVPSFGDEILNACNAQLQADGATKTYKFNKLLTASFSANTGKHVGTLPPVEVYQDGTSTSPDYNGGDVTRQAKFTVRVTCKAKPFAVSQAELYTSVTPADVKQEGACPATGMVRVDIRTNREGKVKFLLFRDDGAKQEVVADSKKVANDASGKTFRVNWTKTYNLTKSVNRKYMIIVIGHKFSTPWKPMVLKCGAANDAAGPGGITTGPRPTHDNPANNRPAVIVTPRPNVRPLKPAIKVAPLPRLVCIGGKVAANQCFCPARTKRVTLGPNKYRCLKTVSGKKVQPSTPPRRLAPLNRRTQFKTLKRSSLRLR